MSILWRMSVSAGTGRLWCWSVGSAMSALPAATVSSASLMIATGAETTEQGGAASESMLARLRVRRGDWRALLRLSAFSVLCLCLSLSVGAAW